MLLDGLLRCFFVLAAAMANDHARTSPQKSVLAYEKQIESCLNREDFVAARRSYTAMYRAYGNSNDQTSWSAQDKKTPRRVTAALSKARAHVEKYEHQELISRLAAQDSTLHEDSDAGETKSPERESPRLTRKVTLPSSTPAPTAPRAATANAAAAPSYADAAPAANAAAAPSNADAEPTANAAAAPSYADAKPTANAAPAQRRAGASSTPANGASAADGASVASADDASAGRRAQYVPTLTDYQRPYDGSMNSSIPECGASKPFSPSANKECEWSSDDNAYVMHASSTKFATRDPQNIPHGWIWSRAIGSCNKRGAVRSHALTSLALEGREGPTSDAPAGKKMHAAPFGKEFSNIPTIELSITVVATKTDVPNDWIQGFHRFALEHCISHIGALERGDKQKNLHIQATARIHTHPEQMDVIKSFMVDYFTGFSATNNTKVQVKPLEGTQTYLGMIGYVLKVEGQPTNFGGFVCSDDITEEVRQSAKKEYHRMRPDILAGKVKLTPTNIVEQAFKFWKHHLSGLSACRLTLMLTLMVESEDYITDPASCNKQACDFVRAQAIWDQITGRVALTEGLVFNQLFRIQTRDVARCHRNDQKDLLAIGRDDDALYAGRSFSWLKSYSDGAAADKQRDL
ncbi:hypothetical protein M885DRAFT_578156 [Pelagophyceae sp. CCMP2097]|nr:hypothetical protein M885DRAFT_578156 [Pelagophyceae sp. CCMP2097]